ncbi:MAG TPA: 4'-phosphopantetheinyl transferase superfamily protein [Polyangia bacterium]|nr:4'-phosphopantetheinyl transferase superfamily protein [Polyangia bacterium]
MNSAAFVVGRVSLARVRRHADWFAARCLHPRERALAAALSVGKRRVDFIAGRVAAHRALMRLGVANSACVLPEAEGAAAGAPRVIEAGASSAIALSIAHGAGWAIAVAGRGVRLGVDLEAVEPRHASFAAEAFAPGELDDWSRALASRADDARVVTVAWCVKEALLKLAECGLRAPLPAMVPTRIDLQSRRICTRELGECRLALEVDGARVTAVAWSTMEEGA